MMPLIYTGSSLIQPVEVSVSADSVGNITCTAITASGKQHILATGVVASKEKLEMYLKHSLDKKPIMQI